LYSSIDKDNHCSCIFCKKRKKHKNKELPLQSSKKETLQTIKIKANEIEDFALLQKLEKMVENGQVILYHDLCRKSYMNKVRSVQTATQEKNEWHFIREVHKKAFQLICQYVGDKIINQKSNCFLSFLKMMYIEHCNNTCNAKVDAHNLELRLSNTFGKKIKFENIKNQRVLLPAGGVLIREKLFELEKKDIYERAAFLFKSDIKNIPRKKLPNEVNVSDLIQSECEIPSDLVNFFDNIIASSKGKKNFLNKKKLCASLAQDLIFSATNGRIKPSKQIVVGIALKSMTNSKKIINMMHNFAQCCSYTVLKELETETTFTACKSSQICPEDILRTSNLSTSLAFNNFDRFVDTTDGKDTLHDTVGIIIQNIIDPLDIQQLNHNNSDSTQETNLSLANVDEDDQNSTRSKRRRTFDEIEPEMEAYPKRPRFRETLTLLNLEDDYFEERNILQEINFMWMMNHYLRFPDTPMWVGFNSIIYIDESKKQRVSYLTTINKSPTDKAVVMETMKQSLKIAEECNETYMQVTYDLAVAKLAYQIQSTESPRFDKLFIHIGTFHVMMTYFKAVGKFIDNCGLTSLMENAEIIANGSINSYIQSKHFNRCKKLHPLSSLALQILHFESFIEETEIIITESMKTYFNEFKKKNSLSPMIEHPDVLLLLEKYKEYKKKR